MATQQNDPQDGPETRERDYADSFLAHSEQMRLFRESHPIWTVASQAYVNMTAPYCVGRSLTETGGSTGPADESYWMSLVPMQEPAKRRFVVN